jgi:predicted PurR-regulated permease PerM
VSPSGWRRLWFAIAGIVGLFAAYVFVEHIPRTVTIFLIAAFIAFGLEPLCRKIAQRGVPKALAIAIVFLALSILVVLLLLVIVPLTYAELQSLAANMPSYVATVQVWSQSAELWVQSHVPGLHVPSNAFDIGALGSQRLTSLASGTLTSLGVILVQTATAFFVAFSAIVVSFLFLLNNTQIVESFVSLFPVKRRATARTLATEVAETFGRFIGGQVLVSAITGGIVAIFSALIGFKFSLVLGIVTAVAYAIPVIGMLIAQGIAVVLCAPQGGWMILWVQAIMFVMARISDNILAPRIMGQSVGVSPLGIMFASFAGGELFGIPGLLLGIPAAALIKILWRYFAAPWLHAVLDRE